MSPGFIMSSILLYFLTVNLPGAVGRVPARRMRQCFGKKKLEQEFVASRNLYLSIMNDPLTCDEVYYKPEENFQ